MSDEGNLIDVIIGVAAFIGIMVAFTKMDDKTKGGISIGLLMFIGVVIFLMMIYGFSD